MRTDYPFARQTGFSLWLASLVCALHFLAAASFAADPTLTATVEPAEIAPGSYATFSITINGGRPDEAPSLTMPEGVELASGATGYRNQTSIINGVITYTSVLTWQISGNSEGEYTIPAQEVHLGGKPFRSNDVKFVVKENPASPSSQFNPLMTIEIPKREFYIGEVLPVTVNLYVHRRTQLRRVGLIEIPKDNFAIQRFPLQSDENIVNMGGVPYRLRDFKSTMSALKAGKFKLGPATSEIIIEIPSADDRFQHPLFSQGEAKKLKPVSNEIEVNVLPLPTEGRPANFSGVVGDFEISLAAEPQNVSVGDPISVEISITGTGNFDALTAPTLTEAANWKTYPAKRFHMESSEAPTDGQQRIGFSQVIIPQGQVPEVPSYEFNYFSPTKKSYVTLRTKPIPLTVTPSPHLADQPAKTSTGTADSKAEPTVEKVDKAQPRVSDVLTLSAGKASWLSANPGPWQNSDFVLGNVAAAGALLLLILSKAGHVIWTNQNTSPDAPARKLWKQLHNRSLSRNEFYLLAAHYIQARQLHGPAIDSLLEQHNVINFSRPTEETSAPISEPERSQVLHALQG